MLTILQQRAIKGTKKALVENGRINKGEILRDAGYSEAIQTVPGKVFDSPTIKKELDPFIEKMIRVRDRALDEMETKDLTKVRYDHLTRSVDLLNKNIQLMNGGPTSREALNIMSFRDADDSDTRVSGQS